LYHLFAEIAIILEEIAIEKENAANYNEWQNDERSC